MYFTRPIATKYISATFSNHKNRTPPSGLPGTDYPCPIGTKVKASKDGIAVRVNTLPSNGKNIKLLHPDGTTSYYLHLSKFKIKLNQRVKQGELIGLSGNTGNSTGPHLHFSVTNAKGVLIDPEKAYGKK